jgi:hypothetical protein
MKDVADFVEAVHVQLTNKGGDVCMLEVLSILLSVSVLHTVECSTYARTFENS